MKEKVSSWQSTLEGKSAEEILRWAVDTFGMRAGYSTSLALESQVLTHIITENRLPITIFTLDTGRLFPETIDLLEQTEKKYGIRIQVYFPSDDDVESMVNKHGINLFYESVELRKECCYVRKVKPLKRALAGLDAWMTGLRREQSPTREDIQVVEWEEKYQLVKINPLADWTLDRIREFLKANDVPYNPLHDQGYTSIGCACCTRQVQEGDDIRAGRWWWEDPDEKECGLHSCKV